MNWNIFIIKIFNAINWRQFRDRFINFSYIFLWFFSYIYMQYLHLSRVYLQVEPFSNMLRRCSQYFEIFSRLQGIPIVKPTQHSEMFSSSTLLFVTVVVSLHFCLRPYFTPRWHFGVTDKTCPSSFCTFRAGPRGGVRKWRWKRALGRRVYRFTVDTSRGSPQSRVSSAKHRGIMGC